MKKKKKKTKLRLELDGRALVSTIQGMQKALDRFQYWKGEARLFGILRPH